MPELVSEAAAFADVAPVTHPPHEKPIIANAIAPMPAPYRPGLVHVGIFNAVPLDIGPQDCWRVEGNIKRKISGTEN